MFWEKWMGTRTVTFGTRQVNKETEGSCRVGWYFSNNFIPPGMSLWHSVCKMVLFHPPVHPETAHNVLFCSMLFLCLTSCLAWSDLDVASVHLHQKETCRVSSEEQTGELPPRCCWTAPWCGWWNYDHRLQQPCCGEDVPGGIWG